MCISGWSFCLGLWSWEYRDKDLECFMRCCRKLAIQKTFSPNQLQKLRLPEILVVLSKIFHIFNHYIMPEECRAEVCPQTSVSRIITRTSELNEIPQAWPQRFRLTKSGLEVRLLPLFSKNEVMIQMSHRPQATKNTLPIIFQGHDLFVIQNGQLSWALLWKINSVKFTNLQHGWPLPPQVGSLTEDFTLACLLWWKK